MDKPFVKNGVLLAILSIIVTLGLYLVTPQSLTSFWFSILAFVLVIFFMVKSVRDYKAQNAGFASFGEALVQSFGTALVSGILGALFTYILYNFIDPGLGDLIKESMIERFESMEGMVGEEAVEQMIAGLDEQDFSMGLGQVLSGTMMSMAIYLLIALIVSAITKKNDSGITSLDS